MNPYGLRRTAQIMLEYFHPVLIWKAVNDCIWTRENRLHKNECTRLSGSYVFLLIAILQAETWSHCYKMFYNFILEVIFQYV